MNANDWQAAADVLEASIIVLGLIFGGLMYRMQVKFVTRTEHEKLADDVQKNADAIGGVRTDMRDFFTKQEAAEIFSRLGAVERQGAEGLGKMSGIEKQLDQTNHMLGLLVKNELQGDRV